MQSTPTSKASALHHAAFHTPPLPFAARNNPASRTAARWRMMARVPAHLPRRVTSMADSPPRKQRPPGPRAISDAIAKCARAGDVAGLDWALRSARESNFALNPVNYTAVASGLARGGEYRRCFETLASMRAARFTPSNVTLRAATDACLRWAATGRRHLLPATLALEEMVAWFSGEGEHAAEVKSWNMVLAAFSRLESPKRALAVLGEMERRGGRAPNVPKPDIVSYNTCMLAVRGDVLQIRLLFARLLRNTEVRPDVISYNTLLKMAIEEERVIVALAGPFEEGREKVVMGCIRFVEAVIVSMQRRNVNPDARTWTSMLKLITKKSVDDSEIDALVKAKIQEIWSLAGDLAPDLILCNAFISAFGQVGDTHSVANVLLYMREQCISADMYTINSVLAALSRQGKVDILLEVLEELREMGVKPDTYTYIEALSSCSRCTPTRPYVAEMLLRNAVDDRVRIMPAMMNATISAFGNQVGGALKFWQKMRISEHPKCSGAAKHVQAYEALFRVCGRAGRPDVALKIVYAMKKSKDVASNTGTNFFRSFERGLREGDQEDKVSRIFAKQYLEHFRTECQAFDMDLPVERIRIRL